MLATLGKISQNSLSYSNYVWLQMLKRERRVCVTFMTLTTAKILCVRSHDLSASVRGGTYRFPYILQPLLWQGGGIAPLILRCAGAEPKQLRYPSKHLIKFKSCTNIREFLLHAVISLIVIITGKNQTIGPWNKHATIYSCIRVYSSVGSRNRCHGFTPCE